MDKAIDGGNKLEMQELLGRLLTAGKHGSTDLSILIYLAIVLIQVIQLYFCYHLQSGFSKKDCLLAIWFLVLTKLWCCVDNILI